MNKKLEDYARKTLKNGLDNCTTQQQLLFKKMYAKGNLSLPINKVVDLIEVYKLETAMDQVERTAIKNKKRLKTS